ncbi:MAG: hypothetical protein K2J18_09530 [Paramuribaculum sp.]|nr:hypothetical protein [Paramuribaculum sp.]
MSKISIQQLASQIPDDLLGDDLQVKLSFVRLLFETISNELSSGNEVSVKGLGRFLLTGNENEPVSFEPEKSFAESVNAPFAGFMPEPLSPEVTEEMLSQFDIPVEEPVDITQEDIAGQEDDSAVPETSVVEEEPVVDKSQPIVDDPVSIEPEVAVTQEEVEDSVTEITPEPEPVSAQDPVEEVCEAQESVIEEVFEQESEPFELKNEEPHITENEIDVETEEDEDSSDNDSVAETSSSGFSTGFLIGLITGLAVGAIAFLLYVMLYVNRSTPTSSDGYDDEDEEYVVEESTSSDSLSVF